MKIAHLVGHSALNGVATSVKALVDAQLRAGHEIVLVHRPGSWIEKQTFAAPLTLLECDYRTIPSTIRETGYAVRDWNPALVHAHGSRANKLAMVWRIASGVPTVMTAHSKQFQIPWLFAHQIIGLSAETVRYYRTRLLARGNIHDVPNLFDARSLVPVTPQRRRAARERLGMREEALVLGSVGSICDRKRQTDMVHVLEALVGRGFDAELLLVGGVEREQPFRDQFDAACARPAVAGRIHLPGKRPDAVELVAAMDVFLCMSRKEEAPIAPLEAMAQQVPVLSTRTGNMPSLLPPERLVDIGGITAAAQVAQDLLASRAPREAAGAADRRSVMDRLSPEAILPRIEAIYRLAISGARRQGDSSGTVQAT